MPHQKEEKIINKKRVFRLSGPFFKKFSLFSNFVINNLDFSIAPYHRTSVFYYKWGFFWGLRDMLKYDYYIDCQKLMPPLDERFPYTAFVDYIYEVTEGGRTRINIDFGEVKGATWKDAERKMRKKVELWISEQKSHFEQSHETNLLR